MRHEYGFKPAPRFLGGVSGDRYFGLELEMMMSRDRYPHHMPQTYRELEQAFYGKRDSSVGTQREWCDLEEVDHTNMREPIEMVSHPMTLPEWRAYMERAFKPWLAAERKAGSRSWSTGSCGLHVHTGKMPNSASDKILGLFRRDTEWTWRVGGRHTRTHLCEYASPAGHGRNSAINQGNVATTEFRLWCGTLNYQGILGTIELTAAMCEWALTPDSAPDSRVRDFLDWFEPRTPHYPAAALLTVEKTGYLVRASE
jgi:hypothetical protein